MFDITFNVGPSQISDNTKKDIQTSWENKFLEISHRSPKFSEISQKTIFELRKYLEIPEDYKIFYTTSATEAMCLAIQNLVEKNVFHFVNGNFSNYFAKISKSCFKNVKKNEVEWGEQNNFSDTEISEECELITTTFCETSTGVSIKNSDIEFLKKKYPKKILAVDITSSGGGQKVNIKNADIWFFSVQKCFGLPSGLGILIVSPQAFEKSLRLQSQQKNLASIFSFENLDKKMQGKFQTIQTPNVLDIFLLGEKCERWNNAGGINFIQKKLEKKKETWEEFINQKNDLEFFVKKSEDRSLTVFCIKSTEENIKKIHQKCEAQNIELGKGYEKLKPTCFRVANFPAVTEKNLEQLIAILS